MSTEIRAVETDGASRIIQSVDDVNSFNNDSMASLSDHKNFSKVPNQMDNTVAAAISTNMTELMNGIRIDKEEIKIDMPKT